MVPLVDYIFLKYTHSLDIYNISLSVDSHICSQKNNSMFSEGSRDLIVDSFPLFLVLIILANYWKLKVLAMERYISIIIDPILQ